MVSVLKDDTHKTRAKEVTKKAAEWKKVIEMRTKEIHAEKARRASQDEEGNNISISNLPLTANLVQSFKELANSPLSEELKTPSTTTDTVRDTTNGNGPDSEPNANEPHETNSSGSEAQ
mmetsp:Transcript_6227/g.9672  ORF Transcript_6227/g.9672 Transcript_6227/m.9672 type:complete len:119 (+) Transcript_6227:638-994(+)